MTSRTDLRRSLVAKDGARAGRHGEGRDSEGRDSKGRDSKDRGGDGHEGISTGTRL